MIVVNTDTTILCVLFNNYYASEYNGSLMEIVLKENILQYDRRMTILIPFIRLQVRRHC